MRVYVCVSLYVYGGRWWFLELGFQTKLNGSHEDLRFHPSCYFLLYLLKTLTSPLSEHIVSLAQMTNKQKLFTVRGRQTAVAWWPGDRRRCSCVWRGLRRGRSSAGVAHRVGPFHTPRVPSTPRTPSPPRPPRACHRRSSKLPVTGDSVRLCTRRASLSR